MNTEKPKIPAKAAKVLKAVYDACLGVASEFDAFDGFYEGGADQLLADFASALKAIGVKTLGPDEGRVAAEARVWDMVNLAKFYFAARGLDISDYPGEDYGKDKPKGFVIKMPSPDGEAVVECPLAFQDWSGKSGLGMIVKINKPNLGVASVTPGVDALYDAIRGGHGFSNPRIKPDPGPGDGKSAWFVRFDFTK